MNKIKKIALLLTIAVTAFSCEEAKKPVDSKIKDLDKASFVTSVVDITKNQAEWKYLGDKPAIVDFYATWCGPCRTMTPILKELADEYDGQIVIYSVDVDAQKEITAAFGISAMPTFWFFPVDGQPQMLMGAMSKGQMKGNIEKLLLNKQ